MAAYRAFHPPPPPPTPHNRISLPPPQPPQLAGNLYSQNWNYSGYTTPTPINAILTQPQFQSHPPPQPPESAHPPPPASGQLHHPSSQNSEFNNQPPPLPPPASPLNSRVHPPPPPPSKPPPRPRPGETKEHKQSADKQPEPENSHHKVSSKEHSKPPRPGRTSHRVETEQERKIRKKRQMDKQCQQLKESQNKILYKTQMLSSTIKPHGSVSGSHMGNRLGTPFSSGEKAENRLRKSTTFLCKLKFRDKLPDMTAQPKLMSLTRNEDRAAKYAITSLENMHKPQLYIESDLGVPLDLLDLGVYNAQKDEILNIAPEDEKLLMEDVLVTPIKKNGLKRKERPMDKGMPWLVKTQYISPIADATTQFLTEKKVKEVREICGRNILDSLNSRERKIQDIQSSFEACKSHPVHATKKNLQPVEILPLFPDFERWNDQFVVATFDGGPTADSENYNKMNKSVREAHESQAIMKSFMTSTSGSAKPAKFLAYMVPTVGELSKDMYDENKDISYTWIREYHWDVRGEDADDPTNYLVAFNESEARYMPLPTKLTLRKKRAREGKTSDEVEHFPVPKSVTVRQRPSVSVQMNETKVGLGKISILYKDVR